MVVVMSAGRGRRRQRFSEAVAVAIVVLMLVTPGLHAQSGAARTFDIPAQPLAAAVTTFGQQSGLQVSVPAALLQGKTSTAVKGELTASGALEQLLTGTGLSFRIAGTTVTLEPAPAATGGAVQLGAVRVTGDDAGEPDSQRPTGVARTDTDADAATAYRAPNTTTATKTDTPVMETPFTVQTLPSRALQDLGQEQSIGEAARYLGLYDSGYSHYSTLLRYRGFASSATLWNGFRIEEITTTAGPGAGPVWMAPVDRLELMRGPASILYGQVEPGGVLNAVTRSARDEFATTVRLGAGAWGNYWGAAEVTGALTPQKNLLGRVIVEGQTSDSYFTYSPGYESVGVAPQLVWKITPRTTLSYEGQYRNVEAETWPKSYSYVRPVTGDRVSAPLQDTRWIDGRGRYEQRRTMLALNHRFDQNWSAALKVMHDRANNPYAYFPFSRSANFATEAPGVLQAVRIQTLNGTDLKTDAAILDGVGHFSTGKVRHTLLVGADVYGQDFMNFSGFIVGLTMNVFNPSTRWQETSVNTRQERDRLRMGLYLQDQMALPGNLHLLAGVRYDDIHEDFSQIAVTTQVRTTSPSIDVNTVTPRVGVLWRPRRPLSLYYSYARNQGQTQGIEYPGTPLDPESSLQHEVGVKTEWRDGRLVATVSAFELTKRNIATNDPNPEHVGFVLGVGEVRSRGVEVSVQGELADGWNAVANYAFAPPKVLVGASGPNASIVAGQRLPFVSNRVFSGWTSYTLPSWSALTVGGGATWQSDANPSSSSFNVVTLEPIFSRSFWLASAFARYNTAFAGRRIQFQLNVENLLDRRYSRESVCNGGLGRNDCFDFWGLPRSLQLEMRLGL